MTDETDETRCYVCGGEICGVQSLGGWFFGLCKEHDLMEPRELIELRRTREQQAKASDEASSEARSRGSSKV